MKRLIIVVGAMVLLILAIGAAGFLIPRDHVATSEITLPQPPAEVWPVVRDPSALQGVWPDLESARRVEDPEGREVWEEKVGGFDMRLVVSTERPPEMLITTIEAEPGAAFGGRWIYRIDSTPTGGSRVRVTEDGWIANPFFRVVGKVAGMHGSLDGYLTALGKHFGREVVPAHVPDSAVVMP